MRVRIEITTTASEIPWPDVLKPGRGLIYSLLNAADPELGQRIHEKGWGPHRLAPFGYSGPIFPHAPRKRGVYTAGGRGYLELGSPVPEVGVALLTALAQRDTISWGPVQLRVLTVTVDKTPPPSSTFRTVTPVVLKSGRPPNLIAPSGGQNCLPGEAEFAARLQANLQRKAETLGLDPAPALQRITWIGPRRSFAVGDGYKPGAAVEVELSGTGRPALIAPTGGQNGEILAALRDWGLGAANAAGFGWVAA